MQNSVHALSFCRTICREHTILDIIPRGQMEAKNHGRLHQCLVEITAKVFYFPLNFNICYDLDASSPKFIQGFGRIDNLLAFISWQNWDGTNGYLKEYVMIIVFDLPTITDQADMGIGGLSLTA